MEWNPGDVIRVECSQNTDPQMVVIYLAGGFQPSIDYTLYKMIQQPLGLPDLVC